MDDFLENSCKSFGVYCNFTSPHEAGIARAEIAFQVCPALARLSELLDMPLYGRICAEQMDSLDRLLSDEETGLWYLGYGESGRSASLWARGCAFLLRALADLLPRNSRALPAWSAAKFQSLCAVLGRLQGPGGGFHQVLDEHDTRLETSATAWIAACLFKGMSHGLLDATHKLVAEAALGFVQRRLWDGLSSSLCGATTVSQDKAYYRARPFLTATYGHFALLALLERAFHFQTQQATRPGDA